MSGRVLKFGGTSLANADRVLRAAERVVSIRDAGEVPVVVVSAPGRYTDRLISRFQGTVANTSSRFVLRERDRFIATGELLSAALLAAALESIGAPARSFTGVEAGVGACGDFGSGQIDEVDPTALRSAIEAGLIPVVTGFQGARADGEMVTLGRGGSDTSAVAIAAALGFDCDIITDVQGVCDCDPRVDSRARLFESLDHETLLQLTETGAEVVHPEAARIGLAHLVTLRVYHHSAPFRRPGGTLIQAPVALQVVS